MSKTTFRKVLIANRGEIALRIMRSCRSMGIASVAVYSDFDQNAPHVQFADEAVNIGTSAAVDSYLSFDRVIAAARRTRADAIHPGYGFLSENAAFARACSDAGLTFIGPSPETISSMGDKVLARRAASAAGLPVLAGYDGNDQGAAALRDAVLGLGLPVMIKAAGGGGGRGMRIIRDAADIDSSISAASREADRAFGDGRVFVEKLIESARHVEVQILGDHHGNLVHLFERDCSLQRRHQKVIEESPAPFLPAGLSDRLCEMAVTLGRSIGYTNAGTVEFLVTPHGDVFFIEVNTRLQVEHPVTEMVTGLDLVRLQIEVAEGRPLGFTQSDVRTGGHAIEARLYAEDPSNAFVPSTGVITHCVLPDNVSGLRIDSGIERGVEVGIHYDPLLAKLTAHGNDRSDALRRLVYGLKHTHVHGLVTNRQFLIRLLELQGSEARSLATTLIDERLDELSAPSDPSDNVMAAAAVAVHLARSWQQQNNITARLPLSYRNNPYRLPSINLDVEGQSLEVSWKDEGDDRVSILVNGVKLDVRSKACGLNCVRLQIDGVDRIFRVSHKEGSFHLSSEAGNWIVVCRPRFPVSERESDLELANAPMPGQVLKIVVEKGQHVEVGEALVILEAMKMEQTIRAAVSGVVEAILVEQGALVSPGDLLVRISGLEE